MSNRALTFQELCLEAVRQRGSDIKEIESYVRERVELLSEEEKSRLHEEIARILAFQAPAVGVGSRH
jgi:hypothetical protein